MPEIEWFCDDKGDRFFFCCDCGEALPFLGEPRQTDKGPICYQCLWARYKALESACEILRPESREELVRRAARETLDRLIACLDKEYDVANDIADEVVEKME